MSTTDYGEALFLNCFRGGGAGTSITAPAAMYVQLHIGDPGEAGTSNNATSTTRAAITFAAAVSGAGTMTSNTDAHWVWNGTTPGEQLTFFSLWDASTSGNCLMTGALTSTLTPNPGDSVTLT